MATAALSDQLYENADGRLARLRALVAQNEPQLVARLAVYAREQLYLRSACAPSMVWPLLLAGLIRYSVCWRPSKTAIELSPKFRKSSCNLRNPAGLIKRNPRPLPLLPELVP
ncbi:hypothetical protein J4D99_09950 [Siccationidurans ginsengisoli]|uniref:hypothetical protein n=1 Tax=Hymenobacter TaxID=89966 RepID=UPI001AAD3D77|nr:MULTISPECIES: hypothetical protein [unclassified Hymenobacter]MBO2031708.1 hypothetical protein [Hymenobacter sp. BT559]